MACTVMACILMACIVMACIVMANMFMACIVMACIVMACLVMACIALACMFNACKGMAYVVMANTQRLISAKTYNRRFEEHSKIADGACPAQCATCVLKVQRIGRFMDHTYLGHSYGGHNGGHNCVGNSLMHFDGAMDRPFFLALCYN